MKLYSKCFFVYLFPAIMIQAYNISLASEGMSSVQEEVITHDRIGSRQITKLLNQTEAGNNVRIIVTLKSSEARDFTPEMIAVVQGQLLNELSSFHFEHIKSYQSLPQMVLRVGHEALKYLLASPKVISVSPDGLMHLMELNKKEN